MDQLLAATNINVDRAAKIKKALSGKFQSNPSPSEGLLARLKLQLEKYREISDIIERDCLKIAAQSAQASDDKEAKKIYDFAIDTPFETSASYAELLEKFENLRVKYEGKSASSSNGVERNQSGTNIELKLRDIQVPEFHGEARKFPEFRSSFETLVHNNSLLSEYEKIAHLKGALKNGAEKIISDATANNVSYPEAWAMVCSWFENKSMILNCLFNDLFTIQKLKDQTQLRSLVMEVDSLLRGLKTAGQDTSTWGNWLYYFVSLKLDETTHRDWLNSRSGCDNYPEYEELKKFLMERVHTAEAMSFKQKPYLQTRTTNPDRKNTHSKSRQFSAALNEVCLCCKLGSHLLIDCDQFKSLAPHKRYLLVRTARLCFKCFSTQHSVTSCKKRSCEKCSGEHHTLLHFSDRNERTKGEKTASNLSTPASLSSGILGSGSANFSTGSSATTSGNQGTTSTPFGKVVDEQAEPRSCSAAVRSDSCYVLLPTAVVAFQSGSARGLARIMFDCCSQPTVVSDALVEKYKLPVFRSNTSIAGLGSLLESSHSCRLVLSSRVSSFEIEINADVVAASTLSYRVPASLAARISNPPNLKLAEKKLPYSTIDIILGNEYYDRCVIGDKVVIDNVTFKNTHFGWTPTGPIDTSGVCNSIVHCHLSTRTIQEDLRKFWEIEEVNPTSEVEPEGNKCALHFEQTYRRDESGQFVVRLPLKSSPDVLGPSRERAFRALSFSERKADPLLRELYRKFMEEYLELGHMRLIPPEEIDPSRGYYLNHHAVLRPSSTTTKLRVVFNASAPTKNGPSLNEILMCGPKLQFDLFDILLVFRLHAIALSADIEKMYRKVLVDKSDRFLQKILWRADPSQPVREYELCTVTYGTVSASFQAQKCLQIIAEELAASDPLAAAVIRSNFYMDDLLFSAPSVEEAQNLRSAIHEALAKAHFNLRKYVSNSKEVLRSIEPECVESSAVELLPETEVHVLGLIWDPVQDVFRVKLNVPGTTDDRIVTKRLILSFIARIFDPLGFLAPFVIRFKILLQKMWAEKFDWDETVTANGHKEFTDLKKSIQDLSSFSVQRPYCLRSGVVSRQLIGFCDASNVAYCATVYLQSTLENGESYVYLIAAKTKVAPIAKRKGAKGNADDLTIHRLELMAAVLLAELVKRVSSRLNMKTEDALVFSDSQVTLCWLAKPPENWKTFVQNRVAKVQALLPFKCWRYVRSRENPADLGTRGLSARELLNSELWLFGPKFLVENYGIEADSVVDANLLDKCSFLIASSQAVCVCLTASNPPENLEFKISSFPRLLNVVARVLRWKSNVSARSREEISPAELKSSFVALVKWSQISSFRREIELLSKGESLPSKSNLIKFNPFLDSSGILRVGGRLINADLSDDRKFPILVSAKSDLVQLYTRYLHEKYFHAGARFLTCFLANRFYVIGGVRSLSKRIVFKCVICARFNKKPNSQQMGQLPVERVRFSAPFSAVMIDFAGPFTTKCVGHRSVTFFKSYLLVFVCMAIRAVHLEVTSSMKTESLLDAFHRFSARRGQPTKVYSDNGSNFKEAKSILGIDWDMGPPYGPHHQGLVESAVKPAKRALHKVTRDRVLTFEELNTLFAQVEAALNSRPLCRSGDGYLTPGHFLIGRHLLIPDDFEGREASLELRKHLTDKLFRDFWQCWYKEYIQELATRSKWFKPEENLRPGDMVLIALPNMKPTFWPLGRIVEVSAGVDGLVRRATVRIGEKVFERPITRIVRLPVENTSASILPGTVSAVALPTVCHLTRSSTRESGAAWSTWRSIFV